MAEKPQTEARATIAAYQRGEISIEEAERRAQAWYDAYRGKAPQLPEDERTA